MIADKLIDRLIKDGFIIEENDIAWVGVHLEILYEIPGDIMSCNFRDEIYKIHRGIKFRLSKFADKVTSAEQMYGYVAFNISKRTKDKKMFNWEKNKSENNKM